MAGNNSTIFSNGSGEPFRFDLDKFAASWDRKESDINKAQGRHSGAQAQMIHELINEYKIGVSRDAIKKWIQKKNGPNDPDTILTLEKYLDCSLRMPCPQPDTQERSIPSMTTVNFSSAPVRDIPAAESSAARTLYHLLADLIRRHKQVMYLYWHAGFPLIEEQAWADLVPTDYPTYSDIQNSIWKLGFDLPPQIRNDALRLARRIYGYFNTFEEKTPSAPFPSMYHDMDDFTASTGLESVADIGMDDWFEFTASQAQDYYETLDIIFSDYRS